MVIRNDNRFSQKVPTGSWRIASVAFLAWGLLSGQALAQSPPILLDGPISIEQTLDHVDHYIDSTWDLSLEAAASAQAKEFSPIPGKYPDFGYTTDRIWLRVQVTNTTSDQRDWLIYVPENFKQYFRVDIARKDGSIDTVLNLAVDSPFSTRPVRHPEMVAPFMLEPGQSATVLISYWSEGSSNLVFSFETPKSFNEVSSRQIAKNFVFYGMMMLLITAALVSLMLLRTWIFLAYSAYAAAALFYIMHIDGVAFQYLWPNLPSFNSRASIFAGTGIIVFGAIYARVYLKTKLLHPVIDKVLLATIGLTLAMNAGLYFTNPQLLKKALVFLSLMAIITFALSGLVAARTRFREVRFYLLAWVGAVASAILLNLSHLFGFELDRSLIYDSIRATMVFDAAMMGLAIADRYTQLRQSQRAVLEERLGETRRNLELSERLTKLTNSYEAMETVARERDEQIQNTVHDLRQPLHSLRLKVSDLIHNTEKQPADDPEQISSTFTYLEELISDYLVQSGNQPNSAIATPTETLELEQVLSSIAEMFSREAEAKGLKLKLNYTPIKVAVDPLVIMRIVSNLVSNAINYTSIGQVTIFAGPHEGKQVISVTDTGPGLSTSEFALALTRDIRLEEKSGSVDGNGLGLSIANDLVRRHGMGLSLGAIDHPGTRVIVTLPT